MQRSDAGTGSPDPKVSAIAASVALAMRKDSERRHLLSAVMKAVEQSERGAGTGRVRWQMACRARPEDDGLVFRSPNGAALCRGNFRRRVWLPALGKAGCQPFNS